MTGQIRPLWRQPFVSAVLVVVAATVGVILPVDFLLAVDGYLMFLRPSEVLVVWGWAWLFYLCFGLAIGAAAGVAGKVIAVVLRKEAAPIVFGVGLWAAMSLVAVALIRSVKLWIGIQSVGIDKWMGTHQTLIAAIAFLGCAVAASRDFAERRLVIRMMGYAAACGFAATVAAAFVSGVWLAEPPRRPYPPADPRLAAAHPDIILVTSDAFAANHASFLGYARPTTPNLDALAAKADVFERYYANSNFTTASVNSFINGLRPWTHRANQFLTRVSADVADESLVARLKRAGYQTDAVWTNALASPFLNRSDRWFDASRFGQVNYSGPNISSVMCVRFPYFIPVTELGAFVTTTKVVDFIAIKLGVWTATDQNALEPPFAQARALIEARDPSRPLFLWVHVLRPHSPYAAPPPYLGMFDKGPMMRTRDNSVPPTEFLALALDDERVEHFKARYDEGLAYFDARMGDFIDWLKSRGEFEKSLVIVSADHGESFSHHYGAHAGPMLYEDVIHVPLLVKEPGQAAGRRIDALCEQVDLMPTVLDLAGVPASGNTEGRSLRPAISGQERDGPIFSMNFEQNSLFKDLGTGSIAMIEGRWKYVRYIGKIHGPMVPKLHDSLYDLGADPGETNDLAAAEPAVALRMRAAIDEQLHQHNEPPR